MRELEFIQQIQVLQLCLVNSRVDFRMDSFEMRVLLQDFFMVLIELQSLSKHEVKRKLVYWDFGLRQDVHHVELHWHA